MGAVVKKISLIGIGSGDPDWVTQAAVKAIEELDVLFVVIKENNLDELVDIRKHILAEHRTTPIKLVELQDPPRPWQTTPDYKKAVATWRAQRLESWSKAVDENLPDGQVCGFLVWGDPSLYESTLAIVKRMIAASDDDFELNVIPGISCVLALAAAFQIPLNRQGKSVSISPARPLAKGIPDYIDDVVVMLDGKQTFSLIDPEGFDIYWAAYLGTPDQILISGDLATVRDEILATRKAAAERKGWMFDTYLLRRR
ncbi:precorrin-6A synthase (deacetylating) [Propionimicrobium lymphophilum]|uniref:precorrin-6A synthase (deacetylating) n=1 Tax=Propionimicrobium lymphophilum TaxID=33012 RepID=UPI0023F3971B|nr:precorrin-6A synthase (deacetylating) [Propionimicrobium lymphophilum]